MGPLFKTTLHFLIFQNLNKVPNLNHSGSRPFEYGFSTCIGHEDNVLCLSCHGNLKVMADPSEHLKAMSILSFPTMFSRQKFVDVL